MPSAEAPVAFGNVFLAIRSEGVLQVRIFNYGCWENSFLIIPISVPSKAQAGLFPPPAAVREKERERLPFSIHFFSSVSPPSSLFAF